MARDLEQWLDGMLAGYSRVEAAPGAVERWMERRAARPRPAGRFLWLPAPAWAAIAFALLVLLGVSWFRAARFPAPQPRLAGAGTHLRAVAPTVPLTAEQKQLIHILQTNPGALSTMKPGAKSPGGANPLP